jgi:hypothetical protein
MQGPRFDPSTKKEKIKKKKNCKSESICAYSCKWSLQLRTVAFKVWSTDRISITWELVRNVSSQDPCNQTPEGWGAELRFLRTSASLMRTQVSVSLPTAMVSTFLPETIFFLFLERKGENYMKTFCNFLLGTQHSSG